MPEKETLARANRARRSGKSPSTQAGEFVREEIDHIREGKHGARSAKQAIAIGLSKARRAGVRLKPPAAGKTSEKTRENAERAYEAGAHPHKPVSRKRSRAVETALQHEGQSAASHRALAAQAHRAAGQRTAADRASIHDWWTWAQPTSTAGPLTVINHKRKEHHMPNTKSSNSPTLKLQNSQTPKLPNSSPGSLATTTPRPPPP